MLSLPQADEVFGRIKEPIVLAVSGGPDSLALMLLAAQWGQGSGIRLPVATVDHALRQGSLAEAGQVGRWAAALGLPHRILHWIGEKPRTRIQETARAARYALLLDHARDIGANGIATAHHGDDQAETILFRLTRGSGMAGLAGMRKHTMRQGLVHWRPLLDYPKSALVALCRIAGHPWIDDPSNRNEAYARTGLRRVSGLLAEQGLDREALLRLGERAARAEDALAQAADSLAQNWPATRTGGVFEAGAAFLATIAPEFAQRLLAREILALTGSLEPLRLERLERAANLLLTAHCSSKGCTTSLGGTVLTLTRQGSLRIICEPPRSRGR